MEQKKTKKFELPFHVVKRASLPIWQSLLIRVSAVLLAVIFCSLLSLILIEANPFEFIKTLFDGCFGSDIRFWMFAKDTALLLCIALAITPAFKMKFWNIGAEGQALVGALASYMIPFYLPELPNGVALILMLLAAIVAGAIWGCIPAVCKALWGTNETLFTLMMNYVASGLVLFCIAVWDKSGSNVLNLTSVGHLPSLGNAYIFPVLCVLAAAGLLYVYQRFTKQGYEISVVGESENTAKYIGINVKKVIIRTMIISGAVCGFAGFLIVGGFDRTVSSGSIGGMGFTAIMVSWLAKFNPLIMIGTSAFITFLDRGTYQVSNAFRVDNSFPDMVIGIVLFFVIGCEFFINYQIKMKKHQKNENPVLTAEISEDESLPKEQEKAEEDNA